MEKCIYIRSHFSDYKKASKEQAKEFVIFLLKHIPAMRDDKLINYINKNKLKNITVEELLKN